MSSKKEDAEDVQRLVDIVVEEVSLVDRAANKHRFLIVKRSEDMEEEETQNQDDTTLEDGEDIAAAEGDTGAEGGEAPNPAVLQTALTALEQLTQTVEGIGGANGEDAREMLREISKELHDVADAVATASEAKAPTTNKPVPSESTRTTKCGDEIGDVLASVKTTLAEVGLLLKESKRAKPKPPPNDEDEEEEEEEEEERKKTAATKAGSVKNSETADPLRKELVRLSGAVTKLVDVAQVQKDRISKLEKHFRGRNSAATGEQGDTSKNDEDIWPLDMNRPFDRKNVDKSMSFHDL